MKLSDVHIEPYSTVLLDRDGTLNVHLVGDYVKRPDELELIPGAPEAVAAMTKAGKHVYIITNQRGIGKGASTKGRRKSRYQRREQRQFTALHRSITSDNICIPHFLYGHAFLTLTATAHIVIAITSFFMTFAPFV